MAMHQNGNANSLDVVEIKAISIGELGVVRLQLRDAREREWDVKLPLDVLDTCLRRLSKERGLVLNVETADDHARLAYPVRAWEVSHDPGSPELTFACRTDDGHGLEIGFNMDPVTATNTVAVTVAAG